MLIHASTGQRDDVHSAGPDDQSISTVHKLLIVWKLELMKNSFFRFVVIICILCDTF